MSLSPQQESTLVSGGDCFDHWHSSDRVRTHDDILTMQALAKATLVSSDTTITSKQDYLIVDTSSGNVTVTLPFSNNGREIEIMKNAQANYLSIVPFGDDVILKSKEVRVFNYGTSLRFKGFTGGWIIV